MFLAIGIILGAVCAILAHSKGRSAIGWFFIGFLLGLIGLIICIVMPNLKEQREKEEQMKMEQKRLEEQLWQERIKNERFQKYAKTRLDVHDETLKIDTRQPFSGADGDRTPLIEGGPEHMMRDTEVETTFINHIGGIEGDSSGHQNGWYFQGQGQDYGPLTIRQIRQHISDGTIQCSTQIWHRTFTDWMPAGQAGIFDFGDAV